MEFRSDNVHGVSPEILAAIGKANEGSAASYGEDELTASVEQKFCEIFERDVAVFPVVTGTAANALGLSAISPPYGAVFCHAGSHTNVDECGAPELYTGGAKLIGLRGVAGKYTPAHVEAVLKTFIRGVHDAKPAAMTITQATESGTVYSIGEISALSEFGKSRGMRMHMDGARFANALVSLDCTPAEMTWKAGIDVLSFGATKNGAMAVEAVVFFDKSLAEDFGYRRMRAGHLVSKSRFLAAQFDAYLSDDLWLINARHANAAAQRVKSALEPLKGTRFPTPVEANELFPVMPAALAEALQNEGIKIYEWPGSGDDSEALEVGEVMMRFVTSFATTEGELAGIEKICKFFP
ncbi:MAG: threonine aldolase family protein [Hyphomicrobiales bacterium]